MISYKKKEELVMKEKLSPAKAQYLEYMLIRAKLYRSVKIKTKGHKMAIDELLSMTSPEVIKGMYEQHAYGFYRMLEKMYPDNEEKLSKSDFTVAGIFVNAKGQEIDKDAVYKTEVLRRILGSE